MRGRETRGSWIRFVLLPASYFFLVVFFFAAFFLEGIRYHLQSFFKSRQTLTGLKRESVGRSLREFREWPDSQQLSASRSMKVFAVDALLKLLLATEGKKKFLPGAALGL